jgi:hypothetical protein
MPQVRDILADLYIEIARIEHLARTRVERKFMNGMPVLQYGILGHLIRSPSGSDSVAGIVWSFQEDEARVVANLAALQDNGLVAIADGIRPHETIVEVTSGGRAEQARALDQMAPDFLQIVSEIPDDELFTTHKVLREIRLVMDNLPDR